MGALGVSLATQVETTAAEAGTRRVERTSRQAGARAAAGAPAEFSHEARARLALERLSDIARKLREKVRAEEGLPDARLRRALEALEEVVARLGSHSPSGRSASEAPERASGRGPKGDEGPPGALLRDLGRALKVLEREARPRALPAPLRHLVRQALQALMRLWRAVTQSAAGADGTAIQTLELYTSRSVRAEIEDPEGNPALAAAEIELSLRASRHADTILLDFSGGLRASLDVVA